MSLMRAASDVAGTRLLPQLIAEAAVSVESSAEKPRCTCHGAQPARAAAASSSATHHGIR